MSDDAASSLRLDTVTNGDAVVIIVRGDLDAHSAPQLRALIDSLAADFTVVELDLGELGFFDSTGVGVVADLLRRLTSVHGELRVSEIPEMAHQLLHITDLLRYVVVISRRP